MAITPFRWIAGLIAACLIVAVTLLSGSVPRRFGEAEGLGRRLDLTEHTYNKRAGALAGRLHLASLVDSAHAVIAKSKDASPIRVFRNAGVPAEARTALDSLAVRASRAVRDSGQMGIDIVFLYDTIATLRGAPVHPNGVVTDYVLPRRADDRCPVIARFGNDPTPQLLVARVFRAAVAAEQLLGPCAYYRAFGVPGREVDVWLRNRGWNFARDGSWSQQGPARYLDPERFGRSFDVGEAWLWEMEPDGAHCALGESDACERSLIDRLRGDGNTFWGGLQPLVLWNGNILYQAYPPLGRREWYYRRVLGRREPFLLADMVRTLGRARFARFWTSDPCLRVVPIVYICAWHASALPPLRLISSRMIDASVTPSPAPPYCSGISAAR